MADFLFYSFVHSECYINGPIITFQWASVARLCFSSIAWTIFFVKIKGLHRLALCFRRRIRMFWLFLTTYKSTVRVNIFSTFAKGKRHRESRTRRYRRARFKRKEKRRLKIKPCFLHKMFNPNQQENNFVQYSWWKCGGVFFFRHGDMYRNEISCFISQNTKTN